MAKAATASGPVGGNRSPIRSFLFRHLFTLTITVGSMALLAVVLAPLAFITVPSGSVGVLWKRLNGFGVYCMCFVGRGTVLNHQELRQEGLHFIWPWDTLFIYDLRLQSATETYNLISKDGVGLTATVNIRFQVKNDSAAVLHKFVGPSYEASVIRPEIGSLIRQIVAKYTAEQVYSTSRQAIEDEVRANAERRLGENLNHLVQPGASEQPDPQNYVGTLTHSIEFIDTLVLGIELPTPIMDAINRKTEQFYLVEEYQYRVEREAKESERKRIEAAGIAAFQRIVSEGISDSYLRWRGIEATLQLAQSKNAKVVVIGAGKEGLPIILGNDGPAAELAPSSAPAPAPALPTPTSASPDPSGRAPPQAPPGATPTPSPSPTSLPNKDVGK